MPAGSGVPEIPEVPEVPETPKEEPVAAVPPTPEEQASLAAWEQEMDAYGPYNGVDVAVLGQMLPYACEVLGAQSVASDSWHRVNAAARLYEATVVSDRAAYEDAVGDFVRDCGHELSLWTRAKGLGLLRVPCGVHLGGAGKVFLMLVLNDGTRPPYVLRQGDDPQPTQTSTRTP